jgi:nitrogen-specific signal transduction histidine kinase
MGSGQTYQDVLPDLRELSRVHEVGLELIEKSHDLDELLGRVLEEYERRLRDLPEDALDPGGSAVDGPDAVKVRALVMFATQATALMAKAAATRERNRIEKLAAVMQTLRVLNHEINNPLTALLGRTQLLRMNQTDPKVVKAATVIEESADRIADLMKKLARVVQQGREEAIDDFLELDVQGEPERSVD